VHQVDFRQKLREQLGFMGRSCGAFDAGYQDEAIRIAQCIRILMHDTKLQTSLLTHLNAKNINLLSTCFDIASRMQRGVGSFQMFNGMGRVETTPKGTRYYPKLEGNPFSRREAPVEAWWNETVFVLDPHTWVSRRDVVLNAADKDGGAHVDAALTPLYQRLVNSGDLGCFLDEHGVEAPITGHHYVALRQMGHELLNSAALLALAT
jgi:hypothetical protein